MEPIVIFIAAILFGILAAFTSETETEEENDFMNDVKLTEEERYKFYRDFWKDKCNFKKRKKSENESLERDANAPE